MRRQHWIVFAVVALLLCCVGSFALAAPPEGYPAGPITLNITGPEVTGEVLLAWNETQYAGIVGTAGSLSLTQSAPDQWEVAFADGFDWNAAGSTDWQGNITTLQTEMGAILFDQAGYTITSISVPEVSAGIPFLLSSLGLLLRRRSRSSVDGCQPSLPLSAC